MAIWDGIIPESDLKIFEKGGYGRLGGFGKKPAIVIVDMTLAFVDERFPQGSPTGPVAASNIRRLLKDARAKGLPIVYSVGTPWKNPAERPRWRHVPNPPEAMPVWPELAPEPEDIIITKRKPSVFFGTDLVSILNSREVDTLIVTGMVTSGCVRATVVDACSYNYYVIIPEECVADRADIFNLVTLFDMHMNYADVLPLAHVIEYLKGL